MIRLKPDFIAVSMAKSSFLYQEIYFLIFQLLNIVFIERIFLKARIERGNVLLKQGDISQAKADFEAAVRF